MDYTELFDRSEMLYDFTQIDRALSEIANAINTDIKDELIVIGIMTGAVVVMGHLLTKLPHNVIVDYLHVSRYHDSIKGQDQLQWRSYPSTPLEGKQVLLVDDIFDEGVTLHTAKQYCLSKGASLVKTCSLVNKIHDRKQGNTVDYCALEIPDRYVFGFGMDYRQHFRNAPGIFALHPDDQALEI